MNRLMEENERLREALRATAKASSAAEVGLIVDAALSQQAEPAPAQDEREAVARDVEMFGVGFVVDGVRVSPDRVTVQYETHPTQTEQQPIRLPSPPYMPGVEPESMTGYERGEAQGRCDMWEEVKRLNATRPAQTEQQAVRLPARKKPGEDMGVAGWNAALDEVARLNAAPIAQTAPLFGDEGHVSVPRGLIGAACSAIDKKRDSPKVLEELRRYTFGDLSKQTAPQPEQTEQQHPDDEAVDRFAVAMKAKLAASREKGRHGWQNATAPHLSALLYDHLHKADPLDVGNLAMMLHQNGQAIELPQEARGRKQTAPQPVVDANFIGDAADSLISVITEKGVHLNVREVTQIIGEALVGLSTQRGEA